MSPVEAKVLLAEDDANWRKINRRTMTEACHQIVIEVDDVIKGLKAVEQARELGVNVALIDGSLPSNRTDGATLAAALRVGIPGVKVVDISAFGDAIKDADAKMPKVSYKTDVLGKIVTEL